MGDETIAAGGVGTVIKMKDTKLDRSVAAKRLLLGNEHVATSQSEAQIKMLIEGRFLAQLQHPNILQIYDMAITNPEKATDRELYLILELVNGKNVSEWVETAPDLQEISGVLGQVSAGLAHIHSRGFIHGDIKPENIVIEETDEGGVRAVICDFGSVIPLAGEESEYDRWIGGPTLPYAAPEILFKRKFSEQCDIYSLAATFCRMLRGPGRDVGDFIDTLRDDGDLLVRNKYFLELLFNNSGAFERLKGIIRTALQRDPEKRQVSVAEFNNQIQGVFRDIWREEIVAE